MDNPSINGGVQSMDVLSYSVEDHIKEQVSRMPAYVRENHGHFRRLSETIGKIKC